MRFVSVTLATAAETSIAPKTNSDLPIENLQKLNNHLIPDWQTKHRKSNQTKLIRNLIFLDRDRVVGKVPLNSPKKH